MASTQIPLDVSGWVTRQMILENMECGKSYYPHHIWQRLGFRVLDHGARETLAFFLELEKQGVLERGNGPHHSSGEWVYGGWMLPS